MSINNIKCPREDVSHGPSIEIEITSQSPNCEMGYDNRVNEIIPKKETQIQYKQSHSSKGSLQEEIRIYNNPFAYSTTNGQKKFDEDRNTLFYMKDAFCFSRRACAIAICCIIVALFVLILLLIMNSMHCWLNRKSNPKICLTQECVKTAAFLLTGMDQQMNPCEDFFDYACGMWNKINLIPEDKSSITTFEVLADQLQHVLRRLLEEPINYRDNSATEKAKIVYSSCINSSEIKLNGEKQIKQLINTLDGWPVINNSWSENNVMPLEKLMCQTKKQLNDAVLVDLWIGPDDKNSSVHIIQMDQLNLGLPGKDYFEERNNEKILVAYQEWMLSIATLLGANERDAYKEMEDVLNFEINISRIVAEGSDRHDTSAMYAKLTLQEFQILVPQLNWNEFFECLLSTKLNYNEPIVFYALPYFLQLGKIIKKTDRRVIQNYVIWRVLMNNLLSHMPDEYQKAHIAFKKILYGVSSERNRWAQCVEWTNKKLGLAVGALFIRENFNTDSKKSATEMIRNIREAFNELLDENEWMDEHTKQLAKEKANAVNERIGYPDLITNSTQLTVEFARLNISKDHFFKNLLNVLTFESLTNIEKLRKPVDRDRWTMEPAVVNAFYNPNKNDIVFPAGILQPFFYSKHFPKSVNYGGIGVVIGHEITHGFDDKGRKFDKEGNMKEWWNNATIQAFKNQVECIVEQYSAYKVEEIGLYLNGRTTQGENIADNGGLKQSFRAFTKYVQRHGEEPLLPGINLTHEQLFFLNYAQIWCGSMRPEDALAKLRTSSHSPGRFRVIGPLSNSKEFSKAFNCPLGSKMNPEKKCVVW